MFQTSRNWTSVAKLLPGMRNHVHRAGLKRRLGSKFEANLLNESGSPIEDYSLVFRELFCVAAGDLAHDLHEPLDKMGVLYDEITTTGQHAIKEKDKKKNMDSEIDLEGLSGNGKGQLLFLVRGVHSREAEHLLTTGYCFAEPSSVIPLLAATLQVGPKLLTHRIESMREYASEVHMLNPGVHIAIFAIRASLGAGRHGFDVLARKDAQNQLPTMQLPFDTLEDWKLDYLKSMDSLTMSAVMKKLVADLRRSPSEREKQLAKHIFDTIEAIKEESEDPIFNDAKLIADPIRAPCRGLTEDSPPGVAILITFRIIVPIHSRAPGRKLTYIPLNFFKLQQQVYKNDPGHEVFARKIYREFAPVLNLQELDSEEDPTFAVDPFHKEEMNKIEGEKTGNRRDILASKRRASKARVEKSSEANLVDTNSHDDEQNMGNVTFAGAGSEAARRQMSSTSLRTSQNPGNPTPGLEQKPPNAAGAKLGKEEEGKQTYIDEMFTITITKR